MIVFDLTKWPDDWGQDEATLEELQKYVAYEESPECYCCGYSAGYNEKSPLALKETEYGTMGLFHYDCYAMNLIKFGKTS